MSGTTKITTTRTSGWQNICKKWAQQGETFEIQSVAAANLAYCKELCEMFHYECHYQSHGRDSTAIFSPLSA